MQCPHCRGPKLVEKRVSDKEVVLDICPTCKGVWFDGGEIEKVIPLAAKDLRVLDDAEPSHRTCPRCLKPMSVFDYPQTYVNVDMCGRCRGLWLDAREALEIKVVRRHRRRKGELEEYAPVPGVKGDVLRFIDQAVEWLKDM